MVEPQQDNMANYQTVKNLTDGKNYFISIVPTNKRFVFEPEIPGFGPIIFKHLISEAAIYAGKPRVFSKPILVIHVDGYKLTADEFRAFVNSIVSLVTNETLASLYDGGWENIYEKYGYVALRRDIWSIWFWQKIKHIFLRKKS